MTKNSYTYVADLGKGTFGDVVLAKDAVGQLCAVKCLQLDSITKRTPMEISNHKKLQHPYIIQFKEIFSDANGLYIVMEFASKGDLLSHIQKTPLCRLDENEARYEDLNPHAISSNKLSTPLGSFSCTFEQGREFSRSAG